MSFEQIGETYAPARVLACTRGIAAAARRGLTGRHVVVAGSAIFLLANGLMAPGLAPAAALLVLLGCIGSLWIVVKATAGAPTGPTGLPTGLSTGFLAARIELRTFALCWVAALALCVLGGEGHFVFTNYDWLNRDAVLADLVRHHLPVRYEYQGTEFVLRAPLGMYLVPAAVGKLLGLPAAHLALLAQNTTILAFVLALLGAMAPQRRAVFLAVFVTFSGIEIVGSFIKAALENPGAGVAWWPVHAHQHLAPWNPLFQYTNHLTQIFWVPNHSFAGWWLAALAILHVRREIDSVVLMVAVASLLFWSPLVVAGALPIVGFLVLRRELEQLLTPRILAAGAAGLCFVPIAIYLAADAGAVPHVWLVTWDGFWNLYAIFIAVQVPQIAVVALYWRRLDDGLRLLSILAIGMLLAIPTYGLGASNDFSMRASILPLALVGFVFASIVVRLRWRDGIERVAIVAVILALGSFTPLLEIQRSLTVKAFAISDCNVLTAWHQLEPDRWLANYFARADRVPAWLLAGGPAEALVRIEHRRCWLDHPYRARNLPTTEWQKPEHW
jgi:hypothetical protein